MDGLASFTKWSKPDTERCISYNIPYMWNLKDEKDANKLIQNRNRLTDMENKFMVIKGEKGGGSDKLPSLGLTYTHYCI